LGRYVVLDLIGEGGMGVVYAAYDPELDRRLAIKLLDSPSP
jgi:serine/threonine protein kinase